MKRVNYTNLPVISEISYMTIQINLKCREIHISSSRYGYKVVHKWLSTQKLRRHSYSLEPIISKCSAYINFGIYRYELDIIDVILSFGIRQVINS